MNISPKDTTQSPALTGPAYCDRIFDIEREIVAGFILGMGRKAESTWRFKVF